jgi:hypothetical protein
MAIFVISWRFELKEDHDPRSLVNIQLRKMSRYILSHRHLSDSILLALALHSNSTRLLSAHSFLDLNSPLAVSCSTSHSRPPSKMKAKATSSSDKVSIAKVHREHSRITKGSAKALHSAVADAIDKIKPKASLRQYEVSVNLQDISDQLEETIRVKREMEKLKTIMWEEKYCDYLSDVLGKVKSSRAWQTSEVPAAVKREQWNFIKEELDNESNDGVIHVALRGAAKELKFPYNAIRSWIEVYVKRCESEPHHGPRQSQNQSQQERGGRCSRQNLGRPRRDRRHDASRI